MGNYITIGPLNVPVEWLVIALGFAFAYGAVRIRLKRAEMDQALITNTIWNLFFYSFLVWKASYVLFFPQQAITNPLSILYFSGGQKGVWLAVVVGAVYLYVQANRQKIELQTYADVLLTGWLMGTAIYYLFFIDVSPLYYVTQIVVAVAFLFLLFQGGRLAVVVASYSLLQVLLRFFAPEPLVFFQFTQGQLIFLVVIFAFIVLSLKSGMNVTKRMRTVIILSFLFLSGYGFSDVAEQDVSFPADDAEVGLGVGNKAPDFEAVPLDGEKVALSDYHGKVVIVNLWATWCPPCRVEMPHMQQFHETYESDVAILAVNLTTREQNTETVRQFIEEEYGLTFPILFDTDGTIGELYQAHFTPTTYVIDRAGIVRQKHIGPMSYEMMERMVRQVE